MMPSRELKKPGPVFGTNAGKELLSVLSFGLMRKGLNVQVVTVTLFCVILL